VEIQDRAGKGLKPAANPLFFLEVPIGKRAESNGRRDSQGVSTECPESVPTSLKLASLAKAWVEQDRELRVRQREELRRALNRIAELRAWIPSEANPSASAIQDLEDFTQTGLRLIQEELRGELSKKKKEVVRLKEVGETLKELAEDDGWEDPVEVSYSHTVRQADGLVTQTQTLTVVDTEEAEEAAATFEKKLGNWEKLRSQMQEELEDRKRQLKEVTSSVSAFAAASSGVIAEVLTIFYQAG
jgi:hypothetical protein